MNKDSRITKLRLNTIFGVVHQLVNILCGLILPRLILQTYGSNINGLVNSITEMLGFITILEMGIGVVVQSALYKPLAQNDYEQINKIYNTANRFFRIVSFVFVGYIVLLCALYPLYFINDFDFLFTALLIASISISMFAQYFFGLVNGLMIQANQKNYVFFIIQIVTAILNTFLCYLEIKFGLSIITVKLTTSIVFLLRPILLFAYVKKYHPYIKRIKVTEDVLPQKWNGFIQHISTFVLQNTDILVLTFFATLADVSIYSVYYLIAKSLVAFLVSYMSGYQSLMGDMLAKKEDKLLASFFKRKEIIIHSLATISFSIAIVTIVPFVNVYTNGITDADYNQPLFSLILLLSQWFWCLRMFYYLPIKAAGDYKNTQASALVEAGANLLISILTVYFFGLIGVAIGTLVSISFRCIYFVFYNNKIIFEYRVSSFVKLAILGALFLGLSFLSRYLFKFEIRSYFEWVLFAVVVTVIITSLWAIVILVFYHKVLFGNKGVQEDENVK